MNPLSLIGFILAGVVFVYGVFTAANDPMMFVNEHAILIVIGGSIAAASIAFRLDRILILFKVFFDRVLKGRKATYVKVIEELMVLAKIYRENSADFERAIKETKEPFLRECLEMGTEGVLDRTQLERILRNRIQAQFHRYSDEATKFRTVGKYPPAFGLMGTTLGMIALLQKIGQAGAQKQIGPAMAVALIATFYGLTLSNLVFGPIAENLLDNAKETRLKNMIIVEGALLILEKTNPVVLCEELNSYLLPSERLDWKKVTHSIKRNAA